MRKMGFSWNSLSMHDWTVEHMEKRETKYGFDITMYGELLKRNENGLDWP